MELLDSKQGIIVLGSTANGKSSVVQSCSNVLNRLRDNEIEMYVNELREKNHVKPENIEDEITDEEILEIKRFLNCNGCTLHKIDLNISTPDQIYGN